MFRALAFAPLALVPVLAAPALAQQSPSPNPTATPHQDRRCPDPLVTFPGGGIGSGQEARISIGFDTPQPSATYTVTLAREAPAPFAVVRSEQTSATGTVFTVRLGETHEFTASMRDGGECVFGGGNVQFTVPVRPYLSIAARRIDRRFTGSGRFGFEARVGASANHLPGASAVRPTVIH